MKIMLDKGAKMPTRAHPWDAGLDLYAPYDVTVHGAKAIVCGYDGYYYDTACLGREVINTGTHIQIPEGYVGLVKSKSGLMVKHGITTDGTIDAHYTGPIKVCLLNHSRSDYKVKKGDKIAQLVILPCLLPDLELVDSLEETDRGDGGFGSTGR